MTLVAEAAPVAGPVAVSAAGLEGRRAARISGRGSRTWYRLRRGERRCQCRCSCRAVMEGTVSATRGLRSSSAYGTRAGVSRRHVHRRQGPRPPRRRLSRFRRAIGKGPGQQKNDHGCGLLSIRVSAPGPGSLVESVLGRSHKTLEHTKTAGVASLARHLGTGGGSRALEGLATLH